MEVELKKRTYLVARLFLFGLGTLWIMGLVIVGLGLWEPFLDLVEKVDVPALTALGPAWYIFTLVLVSVYFSLKVFRLVGKWERSKKDGKTS